MHEFENEIINGIYISRYIASWYKAGGSHTQYRNKSGTGRRVETHFADWLRSLKTDTGELFLTEEQVLRIVCFAENGKLELENSAKNFINDLKEVE